MLSVTNDENDVELNGDTDDEDMVDGEMGFIDGGAQVGTPETRANGERPSSSKQTVAARDTQARWARQQEEDHGEEGTT